MHYNVHYEAASAVFLVVFILYMRVQFDVNTKINKEFRGLAIFVLLADVFDVLSAIAINYAAHIPNWIPIGLNSIYYAFVASLGYQFVRYTSFYIHKDNKEYFYVKMGRWILFLDHSFIVASMFTGWIFSLGQNGEMNHGPFYYVIYMVPFIFLLVSCYILLSHLSIVTPNQRLSVFFYIAMCVTGPILQILFFPEILLAMFTITVGLLMLAFALETPDYVKLVETMKDLEISNEEAQKAKIRAQEASAAEAKFLANMSHEIRTPINSVLGMNELILRESEDPTILTYASNVQSSGQMLLSLVNDILDFSKIDSGRMEILPNDYRLSEMLSECMRMSKQRAAEKNLKLELIVQESPIPDYLHGDETRIQQILNNFLNNAIKYTQVGGIKFLVSGKEEGDKVLLLFEVRDTGIGVRMEDTDLLFESFKRVDEKKNRNIEGTGLGLAISKQLAELMGGRVWAESVYGEGSSFYLEIPQQIRKATHEELALATGQKTAKEEENFTAPDALILAVDDVEMNLKVFTGLLRKTGIRIDTALRGSVAIELAAKEKYDIIFMDHMMPEMDGIETLQKLREDEDGLNRNTPVIMLTANAIAGMKEQYLDQGFDDYLSKPFRVHDLEQMVKRFLPEEKVITASGEEVPKANTKMESNPVFMTEEIVIDEKLFGFLDIRIGLNYHSGESRFYFESLKSFANLDLREQIRTAFDDGNYDLLATMFGNIESTARAIGAVDISALAKSIGNACREENTQKVVSKLPSFLEVYGNSIEMIQKGIEETLRPKDI